MDCSSSNLGSRATGKTSTRIYNVFFKTIWNNLFHACFWKVDIGQTAGLFASRYPQAALSVTTRREMQALCETGECQKNCLFITLFAPYIYICNGYQPGSKSPIGLQEGCCTGRHVSELGKFAKHHHEGQTHDVLNARFSVDNLKKNTSWDKLDILIMNL